MAVRCSIATGNFTAAGTWGVVDATSYLAAEAGSDVLTTAYSGTRSSAFTPGAITISALAVKLSVRTGTTGTISVHLELDVGDVDVAGTEVTINTADLQGATTAALDGGWIVFKLAAPVLLLAATAYQIAAKTSSASMISLFRDSTTDNISRMLITTTTGAPAAADDLVVAGEYTGAGTSNVFTVTNDNTATTDFGAAPTAANGLLTPGLAVATKGIFTYGSTAATNYYLKLSNSAIVYNGGTLNIGTTGTPIPRDSTAVLEFDPAADGDYGLLARNGSVLNIQGLSRTVGKLITRCKLNTDEAANSTSLGVDTDTGWLDNDQIAVASTTRTAAQSEVGTLNGAAGAADLTVDGFAGTAGGILNAHSGTSPTQAEVINITRNVKIRSATSTLMARVVAEATATVDIDWTEFYYLGVNATNHRGIEINTTTGSFNMQFSSVHDCEVCGVAMNGATLNNVVFSNNVMWNLATATGPGCQILQATTGTAITIDSNILIRTGAGNGWTLADVGGAFTNNTVVSAASVGINFNEGAAFGTISGNVAHSNVGNGFTLGSPAGYSGTVSTPTFWRNTGVGLQLSGAAADVIIDTPTGFGNTTDNILATVGTGVWIKSPVLNGDTTFATTNGIRYAVSGNGGVFTWLVDNGDFSTVAGIKTAHTNDINIVSVSEVRLLLRNTKLGAATEVATPGNLTNFGYISSQKHDQTAGLHKTWTRYGALTGGMIIDSVIFNTAAPSLRCIPTNATFKLESAPQFQGIKVAVASGATCTISVWVRKSIAGDAGGVLYAGAQPRLIQRANPALGQNADVVIDTMTVADNSGTWEQLTGTSSTASGDDGVWEFVVDGSGTNGAWINVDDWSAA